MSKRLMRMFDAQTREVQNVESEPSELWVEGYAVRFNSPTVLFECGGNEYKEQIDRNAFSECDMSDVIFNYNHSGKIVARTKNKTLEITVNDDGVFIRARLDGTEEGRKLYDEISKGYIDKMSFQFTVKEQSYNSEKRMWTIYKVKRLYDVSAVDIPAYDDTSISISAAERRYELSDMENENAKNQLLLKLKLL